MRRTLRLAPAFLVLLALPAAGEELRFRADVETEYNSEVVNGAGDDVINRFRVGGRVVRNDNPFAYDVGYDVGYDLHHLESRISDFEHRFSGSATYNLDRSTSLFATERLTIVPTNFQLADEDGTPGSTSTSLDSGETLSNAFGVGFRRYFGRRLLWTTQFSHFLNDREEGQRNESITIQTSGAYDVTAAHKLGASFRYRETESEVDGDVFSEVDTIELLATWDWEIDARTTFSAHVGPAFTEGDSPGTSPGSLFAVRRFPVVPGTNDPVNSTTCDTVDVGGTSFPYVSSECDGFPDASGVPGIANGVRLGFLPGTEFDDGSSSSVNVFGLISLTRDFDWGSLSASWSRSDSQTQQVSGGGTSIDRFRTNLRWNIDQKTNVSLRFGYTQREALGDSRSLVTVLGAPAILVAGPALVSPSIGVTILDESNDNRQETFDVGVQLNRDLTRRVRAYLDISYRDQSNEGNFVISNDFDRYRIRLGFRYQFDPIHF